MYIGFDEWRQERREPPRLGLAVVIDERDELSSARSQTAIARRPGASALLDHIASPGCLGCGARSRRGGAVVDDNHVARAALRRYRVQAAGQQCGPAVR